MKKGLLWGVALLLVLTACRGGDREAPEYMLYFLSDPQEQHGPALTGEAYSGPQGENGPTPGELLEALVAGPQTEGLASPFPRG